MGEDMKFLPKKDLLSLEELETIASRFIARGVRKIRVTGGEPLVRRNIIEFFGAMSRHVESGKLEELTLTTNATQLARYADRLKAAHVKRINVSLDTLDAEKFYTLTGRRAFEDVLSGIRAAQDARMKIKINTVAMKEFNQPELPELMKWAHGRGMDITFIEIMPLGEIPGDRFDQYLPLDRVRETLEEQFTLTPNDLRTGGPARYFDVKETGGRAGFITPLTNNFCDGCNRVRITCTGELYTCLGHMEKVDLRHVLRSGGDNPERLNAVLNDAMANKPERHHFSIKKRGSAPSVARHMSVTGG